MEAESQRRTNGKLVGPVAMSLTRPITMYGNGQGWLFDLWLAERLAAAMGAPTLATIDTRRISVPYRMG